jgi:TRAP-type C4-dicarboxylate transport system permease large subunit
MPIVHTGQPSATSRKGILCPVAEADVEATAKAMLPYLAILIAGVLAVAFVPWFTHVVPALFGEH